MKVLNATIIFALSISLFSFFAPLHGMSQDEALKRALISKLGIRQLIIIFDPLRSDNDICDTMQSKLIAALHDPSYAPIIAPLNLAKRLCSKEEYARILSEWYIYTTRDKTKPNNTIIDNNLVIFIPYGENMYMPSLNEFKMSERGTEIHNLSLVELILGIKIKQLTTETPQTLLTLTSTEDKIAPMNLPKQLEKILVSRIDFKGREGEAYLNRWDIYLTGHGGSQNHYIAGMPITTFGTLLDFFNTKINTRSLFYDTCYAGGSHLTEPYQYTIQANGKDEILKKDLKYLVISATTFETVTKTDKKAGQGNLKTSSCVANIDIKKYFKGMNQFFTKVDHMRPNISELGEIVHNLTEWKHTFDLTEWFNLPAVRFPNTDKFSTIPTSLVFPIDDSAIMRAIHGSKNKQEAHIKIPQGTKMILLESTYVPIPIILGSDIPLIAPRNFASDYFLKELRAPDIKLIPPSPSEAARSFLNMIIRVSKKINAQVSWYIEKLDIKIGDNTGADYLPKDRVTCNAIIYLDATTEPISIGNNNQYLFFDHHDMKWHPLDQINFDAIKVIIRNSALSHSTLPESMKGENQKPVIEIEPAKNGRPKIRGSVTQ